MALELTTARHRGLDGLRGLGIAFVVLYHLGVEQISGGWFFLDGFFVVSGFLITRILLSRVDALHGLRTFWGRRFRRLLPAVLVVVAAVCVTAPLWMDQARQVSLRGDGLASLFYVANWWFIISAAAYNAPATLASPLLHLWTLAIEEQFYLVWPFVVLACLKFPRPRRNVAVAAGVLAVSSAVLMAVLYDANDQWRVYFSTLTHAHGLLLGAFAAAVALKGVPERFQPAVRAVGWVGVAALFVIAVSWPFGSPAIFRGGMFLAEALVAVIAVALTLPGRLSSVFSWAPLVALGTVSYGLYLWHWPVIVLLTESRTGLDGFTLGAVRLTIAMALTIGSYLAIERPFLHGALRGRPGWFVVGGLFAAALAAVLLLPTEVPTTPSFTISKVDAPAGKTVRAIVIGDSVADSVAPGFDAVAGRGMVVTRLTAAGCGWASWGAVADTPLPEDSTCDQLRARRASDASRVDWVVALSMSEMLDRQVDGQRVKFNTPEGDAAVLAGMQRTYDQVTAAGARLAVVLNPLPGPADVEPAILANDPARTEQLNELLRQFAKDHSDVLVIDPTKSVCPTSPCPKQVDGHDVRSDDGRHFTVDGATLVATDVLEALARASR
jgi:peptidoglycan/LPS O-acetylase OafA/YrhL